MRGLKNRIPAVFAVAIPAVVAPIVLPPVRTISKD